jgi:hypothetical protein
MDLGTVRSVHRAKITSVVWLLFLAAFCLAVVVAVIIMPFGTPANTGPLKRWGLGALFLFGGVALLGYAWTIARTRIELCDDGFRHVRSSEITVRWREVVRLELLRINGNPRSLIIYTRDHRLVIASGMQRFDEILAVVRGRAPQAPVTIPMARALRNR